MVTRSIFKKTSGLHEKLKKELEQINSLSTDVIKTSERSLMIIDEAIRDLKKLISVHEFDNVAEEIFFFKNLKPLFISEFIYYSTRLNVETYRPSAGNKSQKKYYENELLKLQVYYNENIDFCSYYKRNATYLDHKYFVRNSFDLKMKIPSNFYNYDSFFTTFHDQHIAQILANEQLELYFKSRIVSHKEEKGLTSDMQPIKMSWTAPKVALIELVYALYHMLCFNGGNIELSEVIKFTEYRSWKLP